MKTATLPLVHSRLEYHYINPPQTAVSYGTCLKCGATNQDLGDGLCLTCYDQASIQKGFYYRRKFLGLCVDCGRPVLNHRVRCPSCLLRARRRAVT